jgi:hypothetical protein
VFKNYLKEYFLQVTNTGSEYLLTTAYESYNSKKISRALPMQLKKVVRNEAEDFPLSKVKVKSSWNRISDPAFAFKARINLCLS